MFVILGGFITILINRYSLFKNKTYKDYSLVSGWVLFYNVFFAMLGAPYGYMRFFFMGMGESKLPAPMMAFSWSILMSMNITFSNLWGISLKEWKGAKKNPIEVLVNGLIVLVLYIFVIKLYC